MPEDIPTTSLGPLVNQGEWSGWSQWQGHDPFEDLVGPFYARREPDGRICCGWRPQAINLNGHGAVHGGALMTFADYSLFLIAHDHLQGVGAVTVSLNAEFTSGARAGNILVSRGEVTRAGRSLVFVRGLVLAQEQPVLNFSGVMKILRRRI